jgi:hypothetical protein
VGCARTGGSPHPDLRRVWREYVALADERAMAIAGHPERDRWVSAATGGHRSQGGAERRALAECRTRRQERRIQAACVLYAVGDEIVWPSR